MIPFEQRPRAELAVKQRRTWDGRGEAFGQRLHNTVEIQTEGRGRLTVTEWGPNAVEIWIQGGTFHLGPTSGNTMVVEWPIGPQRILLPAMMEEGHDSI